MKKTVIVKKVLFVFLIMAPLSFTYPGALGWSQEEPEKIPIDVNDTEWEVNMVFVTAKGKKVEKTDKLIFSKGKFISENFEKNGYEPTNYSLTVEEDGTTKFGTMQVKGKETSFWKGVVQEDAIDGSVHTKMSDGNNQTTYFTGLLISGILAPKGSAAKNPPPPSPPAEVTEPQSEGGTGAESSAQPEASVPSNDANETGNVQSE